MLHHKPIIEPNVFRGGGCVTAPRTPVSIPIPPPTEQELIERDTRQKQYEAAKKERGAWLLEAEKKLQEFQGLPKIGEIVGGSCDYTLRVQQDPRNGNLTVYGQILIDNGNFETKKMPHRFLGTGRRGLKVFLTRLSREEVERANVREFDEARLHPEYCGRVIYNKPIKIVSHAASGKSVHGEFVCPSEDSTKSTPKQSEKPTL